jgi:hypothetical protein
MINFDELSVSYGMSIGSGKVENRKLVEIINTIKGDTHLQKCVEEVRSIKDKKERSDKKVAILPYFVCATFSDSRRIGPNLQHAEMMILDYDNLGENYLSIKEKVENDKDVFAAFESPSGKGLKVIFVFEEPITTTGKYTAVYDYYSKQKDLLYEVKSDPSCKDVTRACFLSYDQSIYINEKAALLSIKNIEDIKWLNTGNNKAQKVTNLNLKKINDKEFQYLPAAVSYLREKIDNRACWIRCGLALASLGEPGRGYFHLLSANPNYNDDVITIDEKYDELLSRSRDKLNISSLFFEAINYGFEYPDFEGKVNNIQVTPEESLGDLLRKQFEVDDNRDPNIPLGYKLVKFKKLSAHIDGLQAGLYIIAAESSVGKTAFLTNICLDLINTNQDVKVLYLSLDDSKKYTVYRFLSILTGYHINDVRKKSNDPNKRNTLNAKRQFLLDLIENDRLDVQDLSDLTHIDQLKTILEAMKSTKNLVLFIDGVYNLEVDSSKQGIRIENIERALALKTIVDKYSIPVVASGELRKKTSVDGKNKKPTLHDIMETGKFVYNANVVWLLSGKADELKTDEPLVTLEFAKNKLSDFKGDHKLCFKRATGTMSEPHELSMAADTKSSSAGQSTGDIE